jgi:hypothetical protein
VDSPEDQRDPNAVDPEAPEWVWRDVGLRIDNPAKLCGAIGRCLAHPEENAGIRAEYRRRVFGEGLNDRASKLIAQNIRRLLRPAPEEQALAELTWNAIRSLGAYEQRTYREEFSAFVATLRLRLSRFVARHPRLKRNLRPIVHKIVRD